MSARCDGIRPSSMCRVSLHGRLPEHHTVDSHQHWYAQAKTRGVRACTHTGILTCGCWLVLVRRAPECANTRQKMMYASTKEFLKGLLAGIGAEVQINDKSEFTSELVNERIYDTLTRK
jgi:Cofilin/tropomyosin-type actin-binding protein